MLLFKGGGGRRAKLNLAIPIVKTSVFTGKEDQSSVANQSQVLYSTQERHTLCFLVVAEF